MRSTYHCRQLTIDQSPHNEAIACVGQHELESFDLPYQKNPSTGYWHRPFKLSSLSHLALYASGISSYSLQTLQSFQYLSITRLSFYCLPMASILLSLPDNLLDAIINFLLASSFQAATDTALFLVCRKFYTRAMRLVYKYHDTSRYSGLSLLRLARLLDADFDSRVAEYVTSNLNITTTFVPPSPEASLYPYNPSNFFANATGPLFRRHIVTFRLFTRWETGCDILPTWTSSARGIPFASVPVFLDLLRLRFPGMRAMWVDLPR